MQIAEMNERIEGVAAFWGDLMPIMSVEEAGEFIQAVSKIERARKRFKNDAMTRHEVDSLTKEMADLLICMSALVAHYGIEADDIQEAMEVKLAKEY